MASAEITKLKGLLRAKALPAETTIAERRALMEKLAFRVADDIAKLYPFASHKVIVGGEGMTKYERFGNATDERPPGSTRSAPTDAHRAPR